MLSVSLSLFYPLIYSLIFRRRDTVGKWVEHLVGPLFWSVWHFHSCYCLETTLILQLIIIRNEPVICSLSYLKFLTILISIILLSIRLLLPFFPPSSSLFKQTGRKEEKKSIIPMCAQTFLRGYWRWIWWFSVTHSTFSLSLSPVPFLFFIPGEGERGRPAWSLALSSMDHVTQANAAADVISWHTERTHKLMS